MFNVSVCRNQEQKYKKYFGKAVDSLHFLHLLRISVLLLRINVKYARISQVSDIEILRDSKRPFKFALRKPIREENETKRQCPDKGRV
jgi:hypothetical protein